MLDVSLFFHECSVVVTSKLDPNYNLVYKFNKYLFTYFIVIHSTSYIVSLLDLVYFLFSYVNIRMIETFL